MDHHDDVEKADGRTGSIMATADVNLTEAPVTWKAYLLCAFASFGGIFFGKFAAGEDSRACADRPLNRI